MNRIKKEFICTVKMLLTQRIQLLTNKFTTFKIFNLSVYIVATNDTIPSNDCSMCHWTDNKVYIWFLILLIYSACVFAQYTYWIWSTNKKMSVSLVINCALSMGAFQVTKRLIPSLSDMFISANLFGNDMCKRNKPKMYALTHWILLIEVYKIHGWFNFNRIFHFPKSRCSPEAMGAVSGCIFLIALFLFIPVPFIFNEKQINEFPHNQVKTICSQKNHFRPKF